jgi:hypothetical protein
MRVAFWAAALAVLAAAPTFGQTAATVHANPATNFRAQPMLPNTAVVQQNMYQQNQAAQQGAQRDTTQSQQRIEALSQRNEQVLQAQEPTGTSATLR